MSASGDVCQLCCEESQLIKCTVEKTEFMELFCHFVFNDTSHQIDDICANCFQKLDEFGQFCHNIRNIHQSLIEVSFGPSNLKYEEHTEELDDEIEEHITTEDSADDKSVSILKIESDLGGDFDTLPRRLSMTPEIVRKLQTQLQFTAKAIERKDMNFDRISRFVPMTCVACKESFESFEDCNEHYIVAHGRSAYWQCCNLILETPYELLDHIRYHESIDVFKCAACLKCFLSSNKLKYHIHRSHLPVDSSCIICDKGFRNLRLLFNHHKSHILISCPNCDKQVSASNYDHHIRTSHAVQISKKRKHKTENVATHKMQRKAERGESSGTNERVNLKAKHTNVASRSFTMNFEPNDDGLYECDVCAMQFKQISLLFSHRNKVHV
ncbi:zinc finger protein 319-like [Contarinia nasturtii]|uniref:zinc finger protein 319-like n=1 Tax=Contarinia nasturtii TaxID=265458 RepID=UPI0012D41BD5|nr:zinc finger protein 319-like [Contarinia nasturtii]